MSKTIQESDGVCITRYVGPAGPKDRICYSIVASADFIDGLNVEQLRAIRRAIDVALSDRAEIDAKRQTL